MSDEMDEIWALYADDGAQALDAMEAALLALAQADGAARVGHVSALFRAVHTFKGNSRVLGLGVVESRAHLAEDLIGLVRDQGVPFDDEMRDILLLAADTLRGMLEQTAATRADVAPEGSAALMAALEGKIARCSLPAGVEPPPEPCLSPEPYAPSEPAVPGAPAEFVRDTFDELEPPAPPAVAPPAPPGGPRLADDPVYRQIFTGMAADLEAAITAALAADNPDPAPLVRDIDGLAHASRQMGLPDWTAALERFLAGGPPDAAALGALLNRLRALAAGGAGAAAAGDEAGAETGDEGFFAEVQEPLVELGRLGMSFGAPDHAARLSAPLAAILAAATAQGFVRVSAAAEALQGATDAVAYRDAELALYEELAAIEAARPGATGHSGVHPRAILLNWCADHVFDTLQELSEVLDRLRNGPERERPDRDAAHDRFAALMRRVNHACQHYEIDTAAQLSMSLLDLFARQRTLGQAPDPILIHIAQGFITTIERVFSTLGENDDDTPQAEALEALFAEAASAAFVSEGLPSAAAMERRLGLPGAFHRVLSPESVRASSQALEAGLRFYIIRADINDHDRLAALFLDWLGSHGTRPITNVTLFQDGASLFDFLIATPLDEAGVIEGLAAIDPEGRQVRLLQALPVGGAEVAPEAGFGAGPGAGPAASALPAPGISAEMLERIGGIATGHAMVHQMLAELAGADLVARAEALLHRHPAPGALRPALRDLLAGVETRLHEIAQQEAQLRDQLTYLQEETVAIRSRPAETMLAPLAAMARTLAGRQGRALRVTTAGGDLALDITLLDTLRAALRGLLMLRLEQPEGAAPATIHLALRRDDEQVRLLLEDDGAAPVASSALAALAELLGRGNGSLRHVALPGGGARFQLSLPVTMVVLDGMVVGIGGIRYVLPVEAIRTIVNPEPEATFRIAAGAGQAMLRIGSDEIVPVHPVGPVALAQPLYVVLNTRRGTVAVPVSEVIGQQLVMLRPLVGVLGRLEKLSGVAVLAGGEVGMVLSTHAIGGAAGGMSGQGDVAGLGDWAA